ncbi:MAG TPA: hypothetical protein VGD81_12870 [Opitutaceae bacterium]
MLTSRRPIYFVLIVAAFALGLWLLLRHEPEAAAPDRPSTPSGATPPAPEPAAPEPPPSPQSAGPALTATAPEEPGGLAAELNAPGGSIERDLVILDELLLAWRTNFPRDGNPVGDNIEITAALTGRNVLGLPLILGSHRAVNARGQLCDRWGTPFFFHQLAGDRMQLRSAGPDRALHTADDVVLTPEDGTPEQAAALR